MLVTRLTEHDIYLFKEGNHFRLYDKLGAHSMTVEGESGVSSDLMSMVTKRRFLFNN